MGACKHVNCILFKLNCCRICMTMNDYAWQCDKGLTDCMKHVLNNALFCDVTLLVGDSEEEVNAHKLVLVSRSPVFYASFEGPMAEKGQLVIKDIEKDTFELFLQ